MLSVVGRDILIGLLVLRFFARNYGKYSVPPFTRQHERCEHRRKNNQINPPRPPLNNIGNLFILIEHDTAVVYYISRIDQYGRLDVYNGEQLTDHQTLTAGNYFLFG